MLWNGELDGSLVHLVAISFLRSVAEHDMAKRTWGRGDGIRDKKSLLFLTCLTLAISSFAISSYSMSGYVDCRLGEPFFNHTIPALPLPDNCASKVRLLMHTVLNYFAVAFILISVGLPLYIASKAGSENHLSI